MRLSRYTLRLALCALLVSVVWSCDNIPCQYGQSENPENPAKWRRVDFAAQYDRQWMIEHPTSPWAQDVLAANFRQYPILKPSLPTGLRSVIYRHEELPSIYNMPVHGDTVSVQAGEHDILFFNNNTHYILFTRLDHWASAVATTLTQQRATYHGNPAIELAEGVERTASPPDMLFGHSVEAYHVENTDTMQRLHFMMKPLVFSYVIHFHITKGWEYLRKVRATLTGMAGGVWLHNSNTTDEAVTLLYDCQISDDGATGLVKTFGVPGFVQGKSEWPTTRHGITLELWLTSGSLAIKHFDVTSQVHDQPQGGVVVVENIVVTPEEAAPPEHDSGFKPTVNPWGENTDIPVDF